MAPTVAITSTVVPLNSYQVQGPEPFSFSSPSEWPKWKRRFERFRIASGLVSKTEEEQVNTLIYLMGDTADDILLSLAVSDVELKKYDVVLKKFEDHFIVKRNLIYERSRFNSRQQEEGEAVDDFITSLYSLSEHCNYGNLKDELIRDRIVVGVRNRQLAEKMQLDDSLTLEKAIKMARQHEAVKRQQRDLRGDAKNTPSVDRVYEKKSQEKKKSQPPQNKEDSQSSSGNVKLCKFCGSSHKFKKELCKAWGKECRKCHKMNHFAKHCPSDPKQSNSSSHSSEVNSVVKSDNKNFFIGTLSVVGYVDTSQWINQSRSAHQLEMRIGSAGRSRQARWTELVYVDNSPIEFKLDPGADVTVISYRVFSQLWPGRNLKFSDRNLKGPDGENLKIMGSFETRLRFRKSEISEQVYVVDGLDREASQLL